MRVTPTPMMGDDGRVVNSAIIEWKKKVTKYKIPV